MKKNELKFLKSNDYLYDTKHNRVVKCYGSPREMQWTIRNQIWVIDAYIYGKPKKNRNWLLVTEHTCEQYIRVANPTAAAILYGRKESE